ncbi:MAG: ankyrin repeat domain-containing protein [Akkermansia sp.]|nr:ankyrin repeat domain-containing protein [Akkermansia sp.]MBQ2870029.1 ankyrin repeat domain-containing protein [Akkermansia sp.]
MSDTQHKTEWLPIIKDMCILVCIMGALGYACNLAMKPFESVQVTDSLVSLIRKGGVQDGKDPIFLKEFAAGCEDHKDFVNTPDSTGRTPLMWAVYTNFNNPELSLAKDADRAYYVQELLNAPGVNIHAKDQDGFTALHWAAWSGMPHSAAMLIKAGLDINEKEGNGYTPLMLAAMRGDDTVVKMLLQLGADTAAANNDGKTAAQLADEKGQAYDKRQSQAYSLIYSDERSKSYHATQQMLRGAAPAPATIDQVLAETAALVNAAKADAAPPAEEE